MKILLVGCGAMGTAMLKGWLRSDENFTGESLTFDVVTLHPLSHPFDSQKVRVFASPQDLPNSSYDAIVFAVKPNVIEGILPLYQNIQGLKASVVSGKMLSFYETFFPGESVVRVMPNTPVALGEGVLLMSGNAHLTAAEKAFVESLYAPLGSVFWLKDESLFNAGTAVSGSGPAYVFLLMEALDKAATQLGFEDDMSLDLARSIVKGAALYAASSEDSPRELRRQVTSPGGLTERAMEILSPTLENLMVEALEAATERGRELA